MIETVKEKWKLVFWKFEWNIQVSSKIDKKKKKKIQIFNIRNEIKAITTEPDSKKDKEIVQTTLYAYIWQLRWNEPLL